MLKFQVNLFPRNRLETRIIEVDQEDTKTKTWNCLFNDYHDCYAPEVIITHRMPKINITFTDRIRSYRTPCKGCEYNTKELNKKLKSTNIDFPIQAATPNDHVYLKVNSVNVTNFYLLATIIKNLHSIKEYPIPILYSNREYNVAAIENYRFSIDSTQSILLALQYDLSNDIKLKRKYLDNNDELERYEKKYAELLSAIKEDITLVKKLNLRAIKDIYTLPDMDQNCGETQFNNNLCLKGNKEGIVFSTKTFNTHYFSSYYVRNPSKEEVFDKKLLLFEVRDSKYKIPCRNIYPETIICMGRVPIINDHLDYNAFWNSPFNDDLTYTGRTINYNLLFLLDESWIEEDIEDDFYREFSLEDRKSVYNKSPFSEVKFKESLYQHNVIGYCYDLRSPVFIDKEQPYVSVDGFEIPVTLEIKENNTIFIELDQQYLLNLKEKEHV